MIVDVNKETFDTEVINNQVLVLADFNAEWCGPCKMLKPIISEIAGERNDVKIVSINIDDEEELAEKYEVSSIPTLIVFKDGKEVNRSVGMKSKDEINELLGGK